MTPVQRVPPDSIVGAHGLVRCDDCRETLQQFRRVRRQDWPVGHRLCPSCVAAIWADGVEVTEAAMDEWPRP